MLVAYYANTQINPILQYWKSNEGKKLRNQNEMNWWIIRSWYTCLSKVSSLNGTNANMIVYHSKHTHIHTDTLIRWHCLFYYTFKHHYLYKIYRIEPELASMVRLQASDYPGWPS